jgi:GT2 family glycosyltransferase
VELVAHGGESDGIAHGSVGRVFVVIPVYNRVDLTLRCIALLKAQTYTDLAIVISDGGSTDGTARRVPEAYPDVVLLRDGRELWWTGAMAVGIDYVLGKADHERDFLLMLNNDTEFDDRFVETLVRVSTLRRAAVGALTVDHADVDRILDAGGYVDWQRYGFSVKTAIAQGETYCSDVDVLAGRGTLVPMVMVAAGGNVNTRQLPHYIADYEYFSRLKRLGFQLGVTYETCIRSHAELSGLTIRAREQLTPAVVWQLLVSRRSMYNFLDHYRFIELAAPKAMKHRLKLRLLLRTGRLVLQAFGIELPRR